MAYMSLICNSYAQVDSLKINFDLRSKGELDNGVKTLIPEKKLPETMIYSRSRMGIDYYYDKLQVYFSAQDIRLWGETGSNNGKNQLFTLSEAWAKYQLAPKFSLKVGRQELSYDNERLVGGLDWSMASRRFDALKAVWKPGAKSLIEVVGSYHNDADKSNDSIRKTIYGISDAGETTKAMQLLYYQFKGENKFQFSVIAMNNILQNPSGKYYDMITAGVNLKKHFNTIGFWASGYYQAGENTAGQTKAAYQFSGNIDFMMHPKFNAVLGTEWLSGKNYTTPKNKNWSFSPLYGTNHAFNGHMDYFFSGNYFNSFGLNDYYLKTNTKIAPNWSLIANIHAFTTNGKLGKNAQGENLSPYLGTELDLLIVQKVGKMVTLNWGHSFMFADKSMKFIKGVSNPQDIQFWSWIAIKVIPQFRVK